VISTPRCDIEITLLQPHNKSCFFLSKSTRISSIVGVFLDRTDRLLSGQRVRVFYLIIEILYRLGALPCLRPHRCRLAGASFGRLGLVQRLHVDDTKTERGAAVLVAARVSRLVDRHHVAVNDLQSDHLRKLEISV